MRHLRAFRATDIYVLIKTCLRIFLPSTHRQTICEDDEGPWTPQPLKTSPHFSTRSSASLPSAPTRRPSAAPPPTAATSCSSCPPARENLSATSSPPSP